MGANKIKLGLRDEKSKKLVELMSAQFLAGMDFCLTEINRLEVKSMETENRQPTLEEIRYFLSSAISESRDAIRELTKHDSPYHKQQRL